MAKTLNFGILGAGLIGKKRAEAIRALGHTVSAVCDVNEPIAQQLSQSLTCRYYTKLEDLLTVPGLDAVVVATSNDALAPCVLASLRAGKHVLVEKPGGRNPEEVLRWNREAEKTGLVCRVGFNHRFHPGIQDAKRLLDEGAIGELMFFRARYGHGGRLGYEKEWRANPQIGGGGELLDQGVHLIDLCRWLGGELELEFGRADTYFWNMEVDDNAFLLLKSPSSQVRAFLHASCTEWKNTFELEIYGKKGKLQAIGLGRSYGAEELRLYQVKPEMGVPNLKTFNYPAEDFSWQHETHSFIEAVLEERMTGIALPHDALRACEIVYETYRKSGMSWIL